MARKTRATRAVAPPPPKRKLPALWIVAGVAVVVGLGIVVFLGGGGGRPTPEGYETTALGAVRMIATGADSYKEIFKNGYPPSLDALGLAPGEGQVGCDHSGLVPGDMVSGEWSGYRLEYRPGPTVAEAGPNCAKAGAESFVLVARPLRYGESGRRSFYVDETGVIHATPEDRSATGDDPALEEQQPQPPPPPE